uniref:39S ribosomal protein L46, mitochondriallike [Apis florea] n=1 Tax=Lepeophtheirus salmonis TaxID=72036 RepID=A0A0K2UYP1_LEPSM
MHRIRSPWEICASVLLERPPRIAPLLTPLEASVKDVMSAIEMEKSSVSLHEARIEREKTQKSTRLAIDDEDAWRVELEEFRAAKRVEGIDRPSRLIVEMDVGGGFFQWSLPFSTFRSEDQHLRKTAERALIEIVGEDIDFYLWGNAPWSHYEYKYPQHVQKKVGKIGRKVFLFKGQYLGGHIQPQKDISNKYSWNFIEEMKTHLHPKEYKAVYKCVWNED